MSKRDKFFFIITILAEPDEPMYSEHLGPWLQGTKNTDPKLYAQLRALRPGEDLSFVFNEEPTTVSCKKGNIDDVDKRTTLEILESTRRCIEREITRRNNWS